MSNKDKNALSFIFKTKIHAILVFSIYGNGKITFEDLCEKLSRVASRSTIQAILIDGVIEHIYQNQSIKMIKEKNILVVKTLKASLICGIKIIKQFIIDA